MKQCSYPAPGAKPGAPSPHFCFSAGVPCPGSSDPHCTKSVLMQNGDAPGNQTVLANVTDAYMAALGRDRNDSGSGLVSPSHTANLSWVRSRLY